MELDAREKKIKKMLLLRETGLFKTKLPKKTVKISDK